jgi:hypothetical protein
MAKKKPQKNPPKKTEPAKAKKSKDELSDEQLDDVAGGSFSWGAPTGGPAKTPGVDQNHNLRAR